MITNERTNERTHGMLGVFSMVPSRRDDGAVYAVVYAVVYAAVYAVVCGGVYYYLRVVETERRSRRQRCYEKKVGLRLFIARFFLTKKRGRKNKYPRSLKGKGGFGTDSNELKCHILYIFQSRAISASSSLTLPEMTGST